MTTTPTVIEVYGLSNADRLDLPDHVGEVNVTFPPSKASEDLGEPFTISALVAVAALKGLVAYLAARSNERKETRMELDVAKTGPNGEVERAHIVATQKGEGINAELARALGDFAGVPSSDLLP
jgi:hypothetical protein